MTATITTFDSPRRAATITRVRRLVRKAGSVLAIIGARWNDFVDSGQLGPSAGSHTIGPDGTRT
jgi:hypothetical protein